jgi:DNA-binding MarR family transcriptional regulator
MKTDHIIALIGSIREKAYRFITHELVVREITGLAPSHGAILSVLFQCDTLPMTELAKRIDRDKSTVTALVKKLANHGYVVRKKDPDDGRMTYISLTEKGVALQSEFEEISEALLGIVYKDFSTQEKEAVIRYLERMLENWSDR